jgi:hypothetical protein
MNRVLLLLPVLLLAACASEPKPASLEDSLRALIGKPAAEAAAALGNPDTMRPQGASTLYIWTARQPGQAPGSKKVNNTGREVAAALRQNPNAVPQPSTCNLTMTVARGVVANAHLTGDPAKCGGFVRAFKPQGE